MAGLRTRARGYALQVLYGMDVNDGAPASKMVDVKDQKIPREGEDFAAQIVESTRGHLEEIDGELQEASKNWRLERMSTVDRNILRLACSELMYNEQVPAKVVLNEAIELAKRFGTEDSASFVNGILDRVAKKVRKDVSA